MLVLVKRMLLGVLPEAASMVSQVGSEVVSIVKKVGAEGTILELLTST
jgi:hypothetical protein